MAASYTFEDLSGAALSASSNPYDALIEGCKNDPTEINSRYETHRLKRAEQQKSLLLSPDFKTVTLDNILARLITDPTFTDPRNCLVFWARPPAGLRTLISTIQARLKAIVPHIWLMPPPNLHLTALEVTHSLRPEQVTPLIDALAPVARAIVDHPLAHPARLLRPMVTYDAQALALSFLPDAERGYTYHHLRRDLFETCASRLPINSRYVVPSAHLTIARYVDGAEWEHGAGERMARVVEEVERINEWLQAEYWPDVQGRVKDGGEWVVGQGWGLDMRRGTLWYGGGETVMQGTGLEEMRKTM